MNELRLLQFADYIEHDPEVEGTIGSLHGYPFRLLALMATFEAFTEQDRILLILLFSSDSYEKVPERSEIAARIRKNCSFEAHKQYQELAGHLPPDKRHAVKGNQHEH